MSTFFWRSLTLPQSRIQQEMPFGREAGCQAGRLAVWQGGEAGRGSGKSHEAPPSPRRPARRPRWRRPAGQLARPPWAAVRLLDAAGGGGGPRQPPTGWPANLAGEQGAVWRGDGAAGRVQRPRVPSLRPARPLKGGGSIFAPGPAAQESPDPAAVGCRAASPGAYCAGHSEPVRTARAAEPLAAGRALEIGFQMTKPTKLLLRRLPLRFGGAPVACRSDMVRGGSILRTDRHERNGSNAASELTGDDGNNL